MILLSRPAFPISSIKLERIRMINVYPAATDTHIWSQIEGKWPRHKMISPDEVASVVAYALSRPAGVTLESISISSLAGNL